MIYELIGFHDRLLHILIKLDKLRNLIKVFFSKILIRILIDMINCFFISLIMCKKIRTFFFHLIYYIFYLMKNWFNICNKMSETIQM